MVRVDHVWVIQREAETEDVGRGDPQKLCLPLRQRPEVQTLLRSRILLAEQAPTSVKTSLGSTIDPAFAAMFSEAGVIESGSVVLRR